MKAADEIIRLTADVVAIAPDEAGRDHVLLIRRGWEPFEGYWALPGGHVDTGEDTRVAAARELAEETGVDVPTDDLIELGAWHAPGRSGPTTMLPTPAGSLSTTSTPSTWRSTTERSFAPPSRPAWPDPDRRVPGPHEHRACEWSWGHGGRPAHRSQ